MLRSTSSKSGILAHYRAFSAKAENIFDVIIIGGGLVGSAAAAALSELSTLLRTVIQVALCSTRLSGKLYNKNRCRQQQVDTAPQSCCSRQAGKF